MTDPDDRQRWQALAEELGLPPEPEDTLPAPPPEAMRVEEVPSTESPGRGPPPVGKAEVEVPPPAEEVPPSRGRRRRSQQTADAVQAQMESVAPAEAAGARDEPVTETRGPVAPGEEPARGRRRRRRGKRAAEAEAEAAPAAAPAAEAAPAEEPEAETAEERPRRGRGRGRGKKADREAVEAEEAEAEAVEAEEPPPEPEDDEEIDDLSNWSVPAWSELIASLYRPER